MPDRGAELDAGEGEAGDRGRHEGGGDVVTAGVGWHRRPVVGDQAQDDLYVLVNVRIDNRLHIPLFLSDFNAAYTAPDDTVTETNAVEANDLNNLALTFPAMKPLETTPLLRESTIPADSHAEGMVILHFLIPQSDWDQRKSATLTITFYHQGSMTIPIPKS